MNPGVIMSKPLLKPHSEPADPAALSFSAPVCLPQGDGAFLVKPGKPVLKITVKQAAARAGVSVGTVYRLIEAGFLEAEHPSPGRITVVSESLERHLSATRDPEYWAAHALVERRPADMAAPGTKTKKRHLICQN